MSLKIRARLGTTAHFCEVCVLKSDTSRPRSHPSTLKTLWKVTPTVSPYPGIALYALEAVGNGRMCVRVCACVCGCGCVSCVCGWVGGWVWGVGVGVGVGVCLVVVCVRIGRRRHLSPEVSTFFFFIALKPTVE